MYTRPPPKSAGLSQTIPIEALEHTQHELRTPLAAILGHAQLLKRRLGQLPRAQRDAIERSANAIEAGCRDLAATIDHLDPTDPQWSADSFD